jgi:predicted secreted acid phosphatase
MVNAISKMIIDILRNIQIPKNPTIAFDIDGTLIDNKGRCIEPIHDVFKYALNNGIYVVLITSRIGTASMIELTKAQLISNNITGYNHIYFRKPDSSKNNFDYKRNARLDSLKRGMNIIMSIGDNRWDVGEFGGIPIIVDESMFDPIQLSSVPFFTRKSREITV